MKVYLLPMTLVATASWLLSACTPPPPPVCVRFCDRLYYAEEDWGKESCGGLETSQRDAERACHHACDDAWKDTSKADKKEVHTCMNCILKVVSRVPNWDEVDDAINDDCRDVCVEGESFHDAWAYFYTDFHDALGFEEEPCPPKFPPPPGEDGGDSVDGGADTQ